jgi:hypothetical protein
LATIFALVWTAGSLRSTRTIRWQAHFDVFGSDLRDAVFVGVFDLPRQKGGARSTVKFVLVTNVISEMHKRDRAYANVVRWTDSADH